MSTSRSLTKEETSGEYPEQIQRADRSVVNAFFASIDEGDVETFERTLYSLGWQPKEWQVDKLLKTCVAKNNPSAVLEMLRNWPDPERIAFVRRVSSERKWNLPELSTMIVDQEQPTKKLTIAERCAIRAEEFNARMQAPTASAGSNNSESPTRQESPFKPEKPADPSTPEKQSVEPATEPREKTDEELLNEIDSVGKELLEKGQCDEFLRRFGKVLNEKAKQAFFDVICQLLDAELLITFDSICGPLNSFQFLKFFAEALVRGGQNAILTAIKSPRVPDGMVEFTFTKFLEVGDVDSAKAVAVVLASRSEEETWKQKINDADNELALLLAKAGVSAGKISEDNAKYLLQKKGVKGRRLKFK